MCCATHYFIVILSVSEVSIRSVGTNNTEGVVGFFVSLTLHSE
jgi:hypothetical protein